MARRGTLLYLASTFLISCRPPTAPTPSPEALNEPLCVQRAGDATPVCYASFVQLLAQPLRFHGKEVQVIGYMTLRQEDTALYLTEELARHGGSQDAIWLDLNSPPDFSSGWVLVQGRFNAKRHGHFAMFGGVLEKIVRIERWDERHR
jgi:hypothetical protein